MTNVLTILVALAAIGLSVWQGYEFRMHNRLSVLPQLEPSMSTINVPGDTMFVRYEVANTGLGPAVLANVVVFYDGERIYDTQAMEAHLSFRAIRAELDALPFLAGALTDGYRRGQMIPAGADQLLIHSGIDRTTIPNSLRALLLLHVRRGLRRHLPRRCPHGRSRSDLSLLNPCAVARHHAAGGAYALPISEPTST